jgi:hypothetical protein
MACALGWIACGGTTDATRPGEAAAQGEPSTATSAAGASPDARFPVAYDTSRIVEVARGSLAGGTEPILWAFFRNEAYRCGRTGHHTFLVVTPASIASDPAALWVILHGGGAGYYDPDGVYRPDASTPPGSPIPNWESFNDEASADFLLDRAQGYASDNPVVQRRLAPPHRYRLLLPSYCDHDLRAGMGTPYPNNPNWGSDGDTVDGLAAAMAAVDHAARALPTTHVFLHGLSAGAVGAHSVSHAFARGGVMLTGALADSSLVGERLADLFAAGCTSSQLNDPAFDYARLQEKVGDFTTDPTLYVEQTVTTASAVPLFDITYDLDDVCCGSARPVAQAAALGYANNCVFMHRLLAEATAELASPLYQAHVVPARGSTHIVTKDEGPWQDAIEAWIAAALAAGSESPFPAP